ncbi:head decoration protein [Candidatus Dependentiae bacterium]|nr:head decoration protein [Candidatus Dependentiae bacterium]
MPSLTEPNRLNDLLKWEQENFFSREAIVVATGENLSLAAVIGKITNATPATGTAGGTNTGAGTCTGVTAGDDVQIGDYVLECAAIATGAGTFKVTAPNGEALPDAEVGEAYENPQINFTLNDGTPDFALGDTFTITVADGSGKVVAIDFAAVDGSQNAYGFTIAGYDATSADVKGVAIVRDAVIVEDNLVWPDGATTPQKTAALALLKATGIVSRDQA